MTEKELNAKGLYVTYWFVWQRSVLLEDEEGNGYSANYTNDKPPRFFDLQSNKNPDRIVVLL